MKTAGVHQHRQQCTSALQHAVTIFISVSAATGNEDAEELEGVEQRTHKRGLAPFVFVPWDQVNSSALNLPISQMDYFLPG